MEFHFQGFVGTPYWPYALMNLLQQHFFKIHFFLEKKKACKLIIRLSKVHFMGNNNAAKTLHALKPKPKSLISKIST